MNILHQWTISWVLLAVWSIHPYVGADTVYLKNGSWIDGRVRARNDKTIEVQIGKIGKLEIAVEDVYEIEKNNRTGEEMMKRIKDQSETISRLTREGKLRAKRRRSNRGADGNTEYPEHESDQGSAEGDPDSEESLPLDETLEMPTLDPQLKDRIEDLVSELQRDKAKYRTRAERHLKAIGEPCVPFLIPLTTNESDLTRISVMRLLNELGDETVVDPCIESLGDSNEYVREYASKTLRRITGENFGYNFRSSPRRREIAQEKWQKWWEEEKESLAMDRELVEDSFGAR